jgi:hypothetical protein
LYHIKITISGVTAKHNSLTSALSNKNGLNHILSVYFQLSVSQEVKLMPLACWKSKLYGIICIAVLLRADKKNLAQNVGQAIIFTNDLEK